MPNLGYSLKHGQFQFIKCANLLCKKLKFNMCWGPSYPLTRRQKCFTLWSLAFSLDSCCISNIISKKVCPKP